MDKEGRKNISKGDLETLQKQKMIENKVDTNSFFQWVLEWYFLNHYRVIRLWVQWPTLQSVIQLLS